MLSPDSMRRVLADWPVSFQPVGCECSHAFELLEAISKLAAVPLCKRATRKPNDGRLPVTLSRSAAPKRAHGDRVPTWGPDARCRTMAA